MGLMCAKGDGVPRDGWQAVSWCRKAAALGHPEAQYTLGMMYAHGDGVIQDAAQAVTWYRQAAEQGHAQAQADLAAAYASGEGVARDDGLAAVWFRRAADQGLASAQLALGRLFVEGRGVPQDVRQAAVWLQRAAAQGNPDAQSELESAASAPAPEPDASSPSSGKGAWPPAPREAADIAPLPPYPAAEAGPPREAEREAGECWRTTDALADLRREAEAGDALAQYRLACICATGDGVAKDMASALRWCREAAEQGLAEAENNLGHQACEHHLHAICRVGDLLVGELLSRNAGCHIGDEGNAGNLQSQPPSSDDLGNG